MRAFEVARDFRGGLAYIYAIPPGSLRRVRVDYASGDLFPEFRDRAGIIRLPVLESRAEGCRFVETHEWTESGDAYTVEVSGRFPPPGKGGEAVIRMLERGKWLVLHTDANGQTRLSGTEDIPLKFTREADTGAAPGETNGVRFTFSAVEPEASPVVRVADWDVV